jgi:hypothetical protein
MNRKPNVTDLKLEKTPQQEVLLMHNPHLVAAERLSDGDWLLLDKGSAPDRIFPNGHYGPYILTTDGKVQNVNYHYATYHGLPVPFGEGVSRI